MLRLGFLAVMLGLLACSSGDRVDAERAQVAAFEQALAAYHRDTGRYPTTEEGLRCLIADTGVEGWAGPYLSPDTVLEGYSYRSDGQSVPTISRVAKQ
ncbi:MAG: type II secretion system protein GspG [Bryobacterales bacterium]|nr:type II secretion system protein GspG [Bryobacterales bacterium]